MRGGFLGPILFFLALLTQVFAPITASLARAQAPDPFANPVICSHNVSNQADESKQRGPTHHHHENCPLCQACCGGVVLFASPFAASLDVSAPARIITWAIHPETFLRIGIDRHHQPRGPPFLA